MKNAHGVAKGLIGSLVLAGGTGIFSSSLLPQTVDSLYGLAGIGYLVFGIWAAVILLKLK